MSDFRLYSGEELLHASFPKRAWLVEQVLREKDGVILVGQEKAGKTILAQQLICSLTSGHPFLDKFKVTEPCKVVYIQAEGEIEDTQQNFVNMLIALDADPNNFSVIYTEGMSLENRQFTDLLIEKLLPLKAKVLIVDPLYFAFQGSLSNEADIRLFLRNIRRLKDKLKVAIIFLHHVHKIKHDIKGNPIDEGDDVLFGSKFLNAWVDHLLLFTWDKKTGYRTFYCNTQRSGQIVPKIKLKLNQPSPLYFEEVDEETVQGNVKKDIIYDIDLYELLLKYPEGLMVHEIASMSNLSDRQVYRALKPLLTNKKIKKSSTRPIRYLLTKAAKHENSTEN